MALIHVDPRLIDRVWPKAKELLQPAVDLAPEEMSIDQIELLIRRGAFHLLAWLDEAEEIVGVATVEFIDMPKHRVAHVGYMGGKGIVRAHVFGEAIGWMRANGASTAQCWCKEDQRLMYEKMGMVHAFQVMRLPI